jgi:hypothetical protein
LSHFLTYVIVPSDTENVGAKVEELLEPYNVNKDVPEYDKKCWCVGRSARYRALDKVERSLGSLQDAWSERVKQFDAKNPDIARDTRNAALDNEWRKFAKKHNAVIESFLKDDPDREQPDHDCTTCNGTGIYKTTYNLDGKWDYWSAEAWGSIAPILKVSDILRDIGRYCPFAIVTPDGKWQERGFMEYDEWEEVAVSLLRPYTDHLSVTCDMHI